MSTTGRQATADWAGQQVVDEITAAGGTAVAHDGSAEDEACARDMVALALARFGGVDILICNAGVVQFSDFSDVSIEEMRKVIGINLWGSVYAAKAVWDSMVEKGYGRIVLTGSSAGLWGQGESASYSISKGAMAGFARSLTIDTPERADIKINVICPAAYTPMSSKSIPAEWADYAAADKVAPVVGWMSSEQCNVSGAIYHAGGGNLRRVQILESPVRKLEDGPIDTVMRSLEEQAEWNSSFHSGTEILPELARAMTI